jgi:high affinity Mn2+ porin
LVRDYASRGGVALNLEQAVGEGVGAFARVSFNDGSKETYEFTDINRSVSFGVALNGSRWQRSDDTLGFAVAVNALSDAARRYFAAGGLGLLIGDGQLPHYGYETILETYYSARVADWLTASADYQFVANPAYNRDRGPVSMFAVRLHTQF